jgi:predicted nucleotidyltransferase
MVPPLDDTSLDRLKGLTTEARERLAALRRGLMADLGDGLVAMIVFGSAARGGWRPGRSDIDVMVVLRDDGHEVLERIGHSLLVARYAARIEAIVLRSDEVASSADVFPLLFDEVREDGVVIHGTSPFTSLTISDRHRRLRIEQELREARIRMRRMVTDGDRSPTALGITVERKLRQVRSALRALLRLRGDDPGPLLDVVLTAACKTYGLDGAPLARASEAPAAAYEVLTRLLAAAIEDADARGD